MGMERHIELPEGWEVKVLGDVTTKSKAKATPAEYPDLKFIGMDCIEANGLTPTFLYDFREFKSSGNYFKRGQVLYGRMRPYLNKVYQAGFDGACSGEFIVLDCIESLQPDYLKYILHSKEFVRFATAKTSGDRPRVTYEEIANFPIPLPPLAEQERIVSKIEELFSELEKGKEQILLAQQQLKTYRQAVLKWAFEGRLTNAEVVDGVLPEGWEWVKVSDLGKVQLGRQRSPKNVANTYPTKYIRAANITENGLDVTDILEMDFKPEEFQRFKLEFGDIVLSEASGSATQVGKPAIWKNEVENCCFQNTVIRLRPNEKAIGHYLLWVFKSLYKSGAFAKIAGGVGINHLSAGKFSSIELSLPPLPEQHRIVQEIESRLSVCDAMEATLADSLVKAEVLRQSILNRAFEGDLFGEVQKFKSERIVQTPSNSTTTRILQQEKEKHMKTTEKTQNASRDTIEPNGLLQYIENKFGSAEFEFETLREGVNLKYEELKEEFFSLIGRTPGIRMRFSEAEEMMKFNYFQK